MSLTSGFGQALSLVGAALTTSYVGGKAVACEGTPQVAVDLDASFRNATDLTSMEFRFAVSNDLTVWRPLVCTRGSDGAPLAEISLAAASNTTVRETMTTTSHEGWKYIQVQGKRTGGTPTNDDKAEANNGKLVLP